jgi:hypothetical protein
VDQETRDLYSSYQQIQDLQRVARSTQCEIIAVTWRVRMRPSRASLILWDERREAVVLIHVEGETANWESWRRVDRSHILTDDPAKRFDYASHDSGTGRAPLSDAAQQLIKDNSGDTFTAVLPAAPGLRLDHSAEDSASQDLAHPIG